MGRFDIVGQSVNIINTNIDIHLTYVSGISGLKPYKGTGTYRMKEFRVKRIDMLPQLILSISITFLIYSCTFFSQIVSRTFFYAQVVYNRVILSKIIRNSVLRRQVAPSVFLCQQKHLRQNRSK